jgi:hypothetical protein
MGEGHEPSTEVSKHTEWPLDQVGGPALLDRGVRGRRPAGRQAEQRPAERRLGLAAAQRRVHPGGRPGQAVHPQRHLPGAGGLRAPRRHHHRRRPGQGRRRRQGLRRRQGRHRQDPGPDPLPGRPGVAGHRADQGRRGRQRLGEDHPTGRGAAVHRPGRRGWARGVRDRAGRLLRRLQQGVLGLRLHPALHHRGDRDRHPADHLPQPGPVAPPPELCSSPSRPPRR